MTNMKPSVYAIALGSNRGGRGHSTPRKVIAAAIAALSDHCTILGRSPAIVTTPIGPSQRRFANAVVLAESALLPDELILLTQGLERDFGRRTGQRWGARPLDLDLILWSGGCWSAPGLTLPHPLFRTRDFVLTPLMAIAAEWRDPISGFSIRQLKARLDRPRPSA